MPAQLQVEPGRALPRHGGVRAGRGQDRPGGLARPAPAVQGARPLARPRWRRHPRPPLPKPAAGTWAAAAMRWMSTTAACCLRCLSWISTWTSHDRMLGGDAHRHAPRIRRRRARRPNTAASPAHAAAAAGRSLTRGSATDVCMTAAPRLAWHLLASSGGCRPSGRNPKLPAAARLPTGSFPLPRAATCGACGCASKSCEAFVSSVTLHAAVCARWPWSNEPPAKGASNGSGT